VRFVTSSAIHLHSSPKSIPGGCSAFSQYVHHSNFTVFAALGGLITPPEQRYRYFDRLFYGMYHLRYSMLQSIQHLVTSRHKQRAPRWDALPKLKLPCFWRKAILCLYLSAAKNQKLFFSSKPRVRTRGY
jgi:hypothetical protein